MKDNREPTLIPLFFIIAGSCLLALPGGYGSIFLLMIALENGASDPFSFLFPLPAVIGFSLLFGYIRAIVTKSLVGWFWSVSFLFNLIITLISFAGFFFFLINASVDDRAAKLFILFPLWTTFVTIASGYYFRFSRAVNNVSLP